MEGITITTAARRICRDVNALTCLDRAYYDMEGRRVLRMPRNAWFAEEPGRRAPDLSNTVYFYGCKGAQCRMTELEAQLTLDAARECGTPLDAATYDQYIMDRFSVEQQQRLGLL